LWFQKIAAKEHQDRDKQENCSSDPDLASTPVIVIFH
jgi:hypothetical protein